MTTTTKYINIKLFVRIKDLDLGSIKNLPVSISQEIEIAYLQLITASKKAFIRLTSYFLVESVNNKSSFIKNHR